MIDFDLIKQVGEIADWFVSLPQKLVNAVMEPQVAYHEKRERIRKAKELAALRDVGEQISHLVSFKGNIYAWINRLQAQENVEEVQYVRELFTNVAHTLDEILETLRKMPISSLELTANISQQITQAKATYAALSTLSDASILEDRRLIDIVAAMDIMQENGAYLIRLVDHHRKELGEDVG